ncbi:MAG: DUF177 domain-containing protein [Limisphaerales bacterium]
MPIRVSVAALHHGDVHLVGEEPPESMHWEIQDPCVEARQSLHYDLRAELMEKEVFVEGWVETVLNCVCVRCLEPFEHVLRLEAWSCLLALEGEDAVALVDESVDLTPHIREDSLLALPQHPLCRPECPGMPGQPKGPGVQGSASDEARGVSSAWSVLDKLKLD